ncbi:hypothetical protein ACMHYB_07440 [Sorangium sp. So ce1128]
MRALDADARQTLATAWFFLRFPGRWWEKRLATGPTLLGLVAPLEDGLVMHLSVDMVVANPENSDEDRAACGREQQRDRRRIVAHQLLYDGILYQDSAGRQAPDSRGAPRA